jgi:hypothetical protein
MGARFSDFDRAMEAKNAAFERGQSMAIERVPQEPEAPPQRELQALEPTPDLGAEPEVQEPGTELAEVEHTAELVSDQELLELARQWESSDTVPEAFMDRLIEQKLAGGSEYVPLREAVENGLRLHEFSREMGRVRQVEQQFVRADQARQQHFEAINDPKQFRQRYEQLGYAPQLRAMAIEIAQEAVEDQEFSQAAGVLAMRRLGINDWKHHDVQMAMQRAQKQREAFRASEMSQRAQARQIEQLSQQRQQQDLHEDQVRRVAAIGHSLDQLRPLAFRAVGLADNPRNARDLIAHLSAYCQTLRDWDGNYSRDHVLAAAKSLAEERAFDQQRAQKQPPKPKPRAALPPQRLGAKPAPSAVNNPSRKRISEMDSDPRFGR